MGLVFLFETQIVKELKGNLGEYGPLKHKTADIKYITYTNWNNFVIIQ